MSRQVPVWVVIVIPEVGVEAAIDPVVAPPERQEIRVTIWVEMADETRAYYECDGPSKSGMRLKSVVDKR